MKSFKTFFLTEGGAAGHMQHPFDIPGVKTGKDLINFFNNAFKVLKDLKGSLKIDGVNVSTKLINTGTSENPIYQFAIDRGSMKPADVKGVTVDELVNRFGEGHGMVAAGEKTLRILNLSIPSITPELTKLGFFNDPNLFLNTEFVQGQTNVLSYDHDFLAIHGINKFYQVTPNRRASMEVAYNKDVFNKMIEKINTVASNYNFKVYGDVPVKIKNTPDYNKVLNAPFTYTMEGEKTTKPLISILNDAKNPFDKKIKLKNGKMVGALSKEVYINVLNGTPIDDFVENKNDFKSALDGAAIYHATRVLGDQLLKVTDSDMGDAEDHEGVVLRDDSLSPNPVKITGDFIVRGLESKFRKGGEENEEDDENLNYPYKGQTGVYAYPPYGTEGRMLTPKPMTFGEMVDLAVGTTRPEKKRTVVIYPGRFQPFHLGHAKVYNQLAQQFPDSEVYISTSDKVVPDKSPFNFDEKTQMILASGVDPQKVVKTMNPYLAPELVNKYDKDNTTLIFAVGEKDMEGPEARFKFGLKKDGSPSYFQKFESLEKSQPLSKHGYITIAPTVKFDIGGKKIKSASEVRELYKNSNDEQRKQIITELYGKFKPEIYNLFNKRIG